MSIFPREPMNEQDTVFKTNQMKEQTNITNDWGRTDWADGGLRPNIGLAIRRIDYPLAIDV